LRFETFLKGLWQRMLFYIRLIGNPAVDFLLVIITLFRKALRRYEQKWTEIRRFWRK